MQVLGFPRKTITICSWSEQIQGYWHRGRKEGVCGPGESSFAELSKDSVLLGQAEALGMVNTHSPAQLVCLPAACLLYREEKILKSRIKE